MNKYRLVVGGWGNERGQIIDTHAKSLRGAKIALGRAKSSWGVGSWGRIELHHDNGEWERYYGDYCPNN
jgi:hypothetical protein